MIQPKEKFTPGPWREEGERGIINIFAEKRAIGEVFVIFDGKNNNAIKQVAKANARLIAAAPAMYEALKEALGFVKNECEMHDEGEIDRGDFSLLEQIEKALSLVDGERE